MKTEDANKLLPEAPTEAVTDPQHLKYLLIAPPKWGKTTMMLSVPDAILLATEEGHAFHKGFKLIIDCWDYKSSSDRNAMAWAKDDDGNTHTSMVLAVEAICASDRFQFVVIDTADMAAKLCLDYHYYKLGVAHATDAGEYGKGWDLALTQPFRQQIGALMKSGRGIGFITHTNIIEKTVGQTKVTKMETTLPSQVQKFLHTQADLIIHGFFGKRRKGLPERDRIISFDGTNEILAGSRVRGVRLPKKYIVDPDKPWKQFTEFFEDEDTVIKAEKDYENFVIKGKEAEQVVADQTISGGDMETPEKSGVVKFTGTATRRVATK